MRPSLPLCLLALPLLASPALAESPRDALFPSDGSCYLRHYDNAHLAKHPDQLVKDIAIGPDPAGFRSNPMVLRLTVSLRGQSELFLAYAYCENTGGALSCGLEGDAGWFQITKGAKGAKIRVGRDGLGFEGASGFVTLGGGQSDDAVFVLPPVPADSCP